MRIESGSAVVTGGASGLGAAVAQALQQRGAEVLVLDLAAAIEAAERLAGVRYAAADVTDGDQVRSALDELGSAPLRVVVNCAGIAPSARVLGRSGGHDLGLFDRVVAVNLIGTFTVMTLGAERMAQAAPDSDGARGVIVNTASIAAYDGQIGQVAYAASKGGVVSLTLPAARDLARHGIRVNAIAPGVVLTPMMAGMPEQVQQGLAESVPFPPRLARPQEYAQLVLAVIEHDYLNGEVIRMDGALRMPPR